MATSNSAMSSSAAPPVRDAIPALLKRQSSRLEHGPFNRVLPRLYVDVAPELLRPPVNPVRLTLHPQGMVPRIVNLADWGYHVISELRHQLDARADSGTQALLTEVMAYPSPPGAAASGPELGCGALRDAAPDQDQFRRHLVHEHDHGLRHADRRHAVRACARDAVSRRARPAAIVRELSAGENGAQPSHGTLVEASRA